ncbi:SCP-like protein [Ancylostoma caninum]|uniref:SCP-like protein n=1 Tax=Ancylostoma caninum TaxID=29170 RepID=A0A368GVZ4_ANCCA|nr:SCP-like protein [Ancylostoma caninum]
MCGANNPCPGDFSDEFRSTALDMHNYYRRLAATGWAKTGDKYAKTAAKMVELKYDKDLEKKANDYVTAGANCPTAAESGAAGENFFKTQMFDTPHVEAFKEAMKYWWTPLEKSGFGMNEPTYTDAIENGDLKYAANILHDENTKVGCAVKTCAPQGILVIDCRYDR